MLVLDTRDYTGTINGQTVTVPAVTGEYCDACGETILDRENGDRFGAMIGALTSRGRI